MKIHQTIFWTLALLFSLTSCNNQNNKVPLERGSTPANSMIWEANPETTSGINNMKVLIASFDIDTGTEEFSELKKGLEYEFKMIFENCTMKGEAHEHLHDYLFPMKDLFNGLVSSNLNSCKESFKKLDNHLSEYDKIFK